MEPSESTLTRWAPKPCSVNLGRNSIFKGINALDTIYPEGINGMKGDDGYTEVFFAMDSGATETVMSDGMLDMIGITKGSAYKQGVQYEVANGLRIPNLGEKRFVGETEEGFKRNMTAQVCDVNKALLSVAKVVAAGNRVVADNRSYIEDLKSGEKIHLTEQGGCIC